MIPPMTTKGATGLFFRKIFPRGHANDRNTRFQRRVSGRNRYSRFRRIIGAYHAGVFCIPLPTHARLARDYRPHVDRATPGDPPCRSATPSPEVVRSICGRFSLRSEEHTSELQSLAYLVCRLLLEKKNKQLSLMIRLVNLPSVRLRLCVHRLLGCV